MKYQIYKSKFKIFIAVAIFLSLISFLTWFNFKNIPENEPFFITINDNGLIFKMKTGAQNVRELITANNLNQKNDIVYPSWDTTLQANMSLIIKRAVPVEIFLDGENKLVYSQAKNIADLLEEQNIILDEKDYSVPKLSSPIYADLKIKIVRVKEKEISELSDIPYKIIENKDPSLKYGKTIIIKEGIDGTLKKTFLARYENGKEIKRTLLKKEVLEQPQDKIIKLGTKIEIGRIQTGLASWYKLYGGLTAASRDFPRGTYLRVTNLTNGKSLIVKVNDYGPEAWTGRIIDLEQTVFKQLAPLYLGVINARIEEIL